MKFVHVSNNCNFEYFGSWSNFYQGKRCPRCYGAMRHNIEFCREYSKGEGYLLIEKSYSNAHTKMNFIHNTEKCKFKFKATWNSFYNAGIRCPLCYGTPKFTLDFCKNEAIKRGYIIGQNFYVNGKTKIKLIHNIEGCNFEFLMAWNSFYNNNQGCPLCASKQKESKLAIYLKEYFCNNYNAFSEFKECINPKTGYWLPYDILIINKNNNKIYVEIQGEQHYTFRPFYGKTPKDFKYSQYKDKIKRKHAESNGVYVEIDLRKKRMTYEQWIEYIEKFI